MNARRYILVCSDLQRIFQLAYPLTHRQDVIMKLLRVG